MLPLFSNEKRKTLQKQTKLVNKFNSRDRDLNRRRKMAGRERRRILVGLALAMFLGVAVYFRLWAIDYSVSSDDSELLRRQFDLANKEAMDESAEWRMRFDEEADKASKCAKELQEIKESIERKDDPASFNKLAMLQKENAALLKQMEALKNELEAEKLRCRSQ